MLTIIKQELDIEESLKTKLSYICEFATTANGKMISRIMMSVSQNEIERTIIGLVGAVKE